MADREESCGWNLAPDLLDGKTVAGPRAEEWRAIQAANSKIVHVCTAQWNADNVNLVWGDSATVRVIPYDLDTQVFAPIPRTQACDALNISGDLPLVAAAASNLSVRRKGLSHLLDAISTVKSPFRLMLMGEVKEEDKPRFPEQTVYLGALKDDQRLQAAYSAADVLVVPSLAEAFGQIISEAMACGTPSIAYDAGGIPEVVQEHGWLVPTGNTAALAETLSRFLEGTLPRQQQVIDGLREDAVQRFSMGIQAAAYAELYQELLDI